MTIPNTAERRIYFACAQSVLLPIGLFWFGWTSYPSIPWIVPTLAVGCAAMGIFSVYLAVFNYLADTYHRYASSAIAAQSCCKLHPWSIYNEAVEANNVQVGICWVVSFHWLRMPCLPIWVIPVHPVCLVELWAPSPFFYITVDLPTRFQGALLTLVPWLLMFFGPKIRAKSKLASVRLFSVFGLT